MTRILCNLIVLGLPIILTGASASANRPLVRSDRPVEVRFINAEWNVSPTAVDKAVILVREDVAGSLTSVELSETSENSGIFSGEFQLKPGNAATYSPQVYIPDGSGSDLDLAALKEKIVRKRIARMPYFLRKRKTKRDLIQVFTKKEDALSAYSQFQDRVETQQRLLEQTLKAAEAARSAEFRQILMKKQQEASARENEREQLAADAKKRREELLAKRRQLTKEAHQKREQAASQLAAKAMQSYEAGDFQNAATLFEKSYELDPETTKYNFQYGVTLYQLGQHNDSLINLGFAKKSANVDEVERRYYEGLNYLKLEDYDQAFEAFSEVQSSNRGDLAPAAAFYKGVIQYQLERLDEAQEDFQYVLDNSSSSGLDEQAETYIEQILQLKRYEELSKNKFLASATFGLNYDSNILLADDSSPDQGTATDEAGYRGLFVGSFGYRPIFKPSHELVLELGLTNLYSVDTSWAPDETLQAADPLLVAFGVPYTWNTSLGRTPYQLRLTPSYELLYMNLDGEENGFDGREQILSSMVLLNDNTFVVSSGYTTAIQIGVRLDDSQIDADTESANADATKLSLTSAHTFFFNEARSRAFTFDVGYVLNSAQGDDYTFNRYEMGLSYLTPAYWETVANANLTFYQADYPDASADRQETNYSLSAGLSKPLTATLTSSYQFSYTTNDSTVSGQDYQKISLMALLTWSGIF